MSSTGYLNKYLPTSGNTGQRRSIKSLHNHTILAIARTILGVAETGLFRHSVWEFENGKVFLQVTQYVIELLRPSAIAQVHH
jgi:hypothetical protein